MHTLATLTLIYTSSFIEQYESKTCCVTRTNPGHCLLESGTGSPCQWLDPQDATSATILASMNDPANCVNVDFATCKAADPTDPCIADNPPPFLLGPDTTPHDCTITSGPTISPIPTPPPTFKPCTADLRYNVQFILDESGSVTKNDPEGYINTVNLVSRLIDNSVTANSQISVLAFSADTDMVYPFGWDQLNRYKMLDALAAEKTNYAGKTTDTYNALKAGLEDFVAAPNCNSDDTNILVLITDGTPYCGNFWGGTYDIGCKTNVCDQTDLLTAIADYGVRIILVGITSGFSSSALDCLADAADIFEFTDFSPESLSRIELEMRHTILCPLPQYSGRKKRVVRDENVMVHSGWEMNVEDKGNASFGYYVVVGLIIFLFGGVVYMCKSSNGKKDVFIENKHVGYSTFNSV